MEKAQASCIFKILRVVLISLIYFQVNFEEISLFLDHLNLICWLALHMQTSSIQFFFFFWF